MSAKTDDAINNIQNIIAKGMPHKDEMYAVQGYCDMLEEEIADLEDEVDNRREDMNTIIPQQDEEIERLTEERDDALKEVARLKALLAKLDDILPVDMEEL